MISCLYDTFKHWSQKGSVWVFSDPHFADSDCKYMDENWVNPEEQISIINNLVHKNDTLIILGDIGDETYISRLKAGYKVLIMGNHDRGMDNYKRRVINRSYDTNMFNPKVIRKLLEIEFSQGCTYAITENEQVYDVKIDNHMFDEVYSGPLFISDKILLSHEPVGRLPYTCNIHGHVHDGTPKIVHDMLGCKLLNVAANVIEYKPVDLGKLIKSGLVSDIDDIHRVTINKATENKNAKRGDPNDSQGVN